MVGQTAADQVNVVVTGGKTWTNDGTLTLGQNATLLLHDGTSAATFDNTGSVTGDPGAAGGIAGASGTQLGTFTNTGT